MRTFAKILTWNIQRALAYQVIRPYTTWYNQTRKIDNQEPYQGYNLLIEQPPINSLVFEGGGAKGIAYVGALNGLEKKGMLDNVESVAGSSAGAIQALIFGLGYKTSDMKDILMKTNMSDFLDIAPNQQDMNWLELKWRALLNITTRTDKLGRGLYEGNVMQDWLKTLVNQRIKDIYDTAEPGEKKDFLKTLVDKQGEITFKDSQELKDKVPEAGIKNMFFTGTNYTQNKLEVFGGEQTPDMPLYLGARISGSFPWAFKTVIYKGNEYMDGGALNNFPMQIFDNPKSEKYCIGKDGANLQTLGIRVDSQEEILKTLWKTPEAIAQSFLTKFKNSLLTRFVGVDFITSGVATDSATYEKYPHRTIQIFDQEYSTLNFNLTDEDKEKLIESGKNYTQDYLSNYFEDGTAVSIKVTSLDELKDYVDKETLEKSSARFKAEMQVQVDLKEFLDSLPTDYFKSQIQQSIEALSTDVFQNSTTTDTELVMDKILPKTQDVIYSLMESALSANLNQKLKQYGYDPALFPQAHFDILQYTSDISPVTRTLVNMSNFQDSTGQSYFENVISGSLLSYNLHRLNQNADQIQAQINQYDITIANSQRQQERINSDINALDEEIKTAKQEEKAALLKQKEGLERQIEDQIAETNEAQGLKERSQDELNERNDPNWEEEKSKRSEQIEDQLKQRQSAIEQQSQRLFDF